MLLNDLCGGVGEDGETKHPNHCQLLMGTKCSSETQQKVTGPRRAQEGASSQLPLSSASPQLTLNHLHAHLGAVSERKQVCFTSSPSSTALS